jgi:DNA repair protein RadC
VTPTKPLAKKILNRQDNINKLFASLAKSTKKQLKEQGEKHAMEIAAMKRANLDTHSILTTKTSPAQTMNDHRKTAHFNAMTKPSETLLAFI